VTPRTDARLAAQAPRGPAVGENRYQGSHAPIEEERPPNDPDGSIEEDAGASLPCSKCGADPRMPRQRWCRGCFTVYRRKARARNRPLNGSHVQQVRLRIANPVYPLTLVVGCPVAVLKGAIVEAVTPQDQALLLELAKTHKGWVQRVTEGRAVSGCRRRGRAHA
jgi:hypothetical protein